MRVHKLSRFLQTRRQSEEPLPKARLLRWIVDQLKPHFAMEITALVCMFANGFASLVEPFVLKWIIDVAIPTRNLRNLISGSVLLFVTIACSFLLGRIGGYLLFSVGQRVTLDLRLKILRHVHKLSGNYHDTTPVGETMYVLGDCVEELGVQGANFLASALKTGILLLGSVIAMVRLNPKLATIVFFIVPLFLSTMWYMKKGVKRACALAQREQSKSNSFLQDHLSAVNEIQLLVRERLQERKAFHAWAGVTRASHRRKKAETAYVLASTFIIILATVGVILYGGLQVLSGRLTVGGLVAFYTCLGRLFEPLYSTVDLNALYQQIAASGATVRRVLEFVPSVTEAGNPTTLPKPKTASGIRIENLSFAYKGAVKVFDNLNLTIPALSRVAIIGHSGCGKSTLAKLITRLYDPCRGSILVDNVDLRQLKLDDLRSEVSYVPQRASLFDMTLEENLRLGNPEATTEELCQAVELTGLDPVIKKLPYGLKQPLGPRGAALSGGERQRVAIARSILRQPRVLILDEATSELDMPSESLLFSRLHNHLKESTLIFITHRLHSISWADRIILLNHGKLIGIGNHANLLGHNEYYRRLFESVDATNLSRAYVNAIASDLPEYSLKVAGTG